MVLPDISVKNKWDNFQVEEEDIDFIYSYLLEKEIPLPASDLLEAVIVNRIKKEKELILKKTRGKGKVYLPKDSYEVEEELVFPAYGWKNGKVLEIREGINPEFSSFKVMKVQFDDGETKEIACELADHSLNTPIDLVDENPAFDKSKILAEHRSEFLECIETALEKNDDLVQIAEAWFPRALLVDINKGYLNLIEAILEEAKGGPLTTRELMQQIEMDTNENQKLVEFSLNLALQEDIRYDEVGPSGEVLWYLQSMEPEDVKNTPLFLKYKEIPVENPEVDQCLSLFEGVLADELEPREPENTEPAETISLLYPHWRSGTLPLSNSLMHIFPTAIESPRVRFNFIDKETGDIFNGWVVRKQKYVYGLHDWFTEKGILPGSLITLEKGKKPGEIIISCEKSRQNKEWIKTVLVGADKGLVFAMLKHPIEVNFDERMSIAIPDQDTLDAVWKERENLNPEKIFLQVGHELAKLNPQGHIHAQEMYASVNVVFRCPPSPVLDFLLTNPTIQHLGDLYFHFKDNEG